MHLAVVVLFTAYSVLTVSASGVRVPLRRVDIVAPRQPVELARRASSVDVLSGYGNLNDTRYVGNITVSGKSVEVILDTGSHDMWLGLDGPPSHYVNTSVSTTIDYGGGSNAESSVGGYVLVSEVEFGNFTIQNQTFIYTQHVDSGLLMPGLTGLIGLSTPTEPGYIKPSLSNANSTTNGNNTMENIFAQNPNIPPQFTMLMSRDDGETQGSGGVFTIGDPIPELADISNQPVLPIINTTVGLQHWNVHLDAIIINGQRHNTSTSGFDNMTVMLDSGTPTAFIDPAIVDLMYPSPMGYVDDNLVSVVPCDTEVHISFVFGGVEIPLDPIDVVVPYGRQVSDNAVVCMGAFMRSTYMSGTGYFVLGTTFLRNVYALYSHNTWKKDGNTTLPFVQLLGITNTTQAYAQYATQNAARIAAFAQANGITDSLATPSPNYSATYVRNLRIVIAILASLLFLALVGLGGLIHNARANSRKGYGAVTQRQDETMRQVLGSD